MEHPTEEHPTEESPRGEHSTGHSVDDPVTDPGAGAVSLRTRWWFRLSIWLAAILVVSIVLMVTTSVPGGTIFPALILGALILRLGYFFLQQLATPPPPTPDPGKLRKVRLTYRCGICGTEVRMTAATDEDPEPPRHCMEDMDLVAPLYD